MNFPISNTMSLSLLKTDPKPPASNEEELKKLEKLVEEQKSRGHKYPLLSCVFLIFHTSGKNILTKTELYNLMEKKVTEDKNKIISSPTERYCIINPNNFKSKIKDILKKKKWFTRTEDAKGEISYTLNPGVVWQITPKIESYLKVIGKRDSIFENKAREEEQNIPKPQEKKPKNSKSKGKKIKQVKAKNEVIDYKINNNAINENNNINNQVNNIINKNKEMKIEDKTQIKTGNNAENNTEEKKIVNKAVNNIDKTNNNGLINNVNNTGNKAVNDTEKNIEKKNVMNIEEIITSKNKVITLNNISSVNTLNSFNSVNALTEMNIPNNNSESNLDTNKELENDNNKLNNIKNKEKEENKDSKLNNTKKKKNIIKSSSKKPEKIIRASRSTSKVIEIKDNEDDFDIIIEDERENSPNNNSNVNNTENITNNIPHENEDINKEIEAILSGKLPKNYPSNDNNINNSQKNQNKKINKIQNKKKPKKSNTEEINLENTSEEFLSLDNDENNVIDLTEQRRNSFTSKNQPANKNNKISTDKAVNKNKNKNTKNVSSKKKKKVKKNFLNKKRQAKNKISPSSYATYDDSNDSNFSAKIEKKKPLEEKFIDKDGNIKIYDEKKGTKKKEQKKNNTLGGKINSILSIGELLLNLVNNEELSQLMNKKIVYFKQKIEKKEKEIADDKKLIENLIHSGEKIKLVKNKDLSELINNLKSLYKTFKDKIEILYGYKEAIEKLEKTDKKNLAEGIANYKQVYIESNQILIKMVNVINIMVTEYENVDEFISILILEEKENWIKQNIGINNYDFKKKIKNARSVDDIAELFKQELDEVKIDVELFKKYDNYNSIKNQNKKSNNNDVIDLVNNEITIDEKNVIKIDDENNNVSNKQIKNKKEKNAKLTDSTNKENINLTNEINLEENKKEIENEGTTPL